MDRGFTESVRCAETRKDIESPLFVAICYGNGLGVMRDRRKAVEWCIDASDRGNLAASILLLPLLDVVQSDVDLNQLRKGALSRIIEAIPVLQYDVDSMYDAMHICHYLHRTERDLFSRHHQSLVWCICTPGDGSFMDPNRPVFPRAEVYLDDEHYSSAAAKLVILHRVIYITTRTQSFTDLMITCHAPTEAAKEFVNARDVDGYTPLHHVATSIHPEKSILEYICKVLVANGADVNKRGLTGHTPLWWAVWAENTEIAIILIDHGANPLLEGGLPRESSAEYRDDTKDPGPFGDSQIYRASSPITLAGRNHDVALLQRLLVATASFPLTVDESEALGSELLLMTLFSEWIWRTFLRGADDKVATLDCINLIFDWLGPSQTLKPDNVCTIITSAVLWGYDYALERIICSSIFAPSYKYIQETIHLGILSPLRCSMLRQDLNCFDILLKYQITNSHDLVNCLHTMPDWVEPPLATDFFRKIIEELEIRHNISLRSDIHDNETFGKQILRRVVEYDSNIDGFLNLFHERDPDFLKHHWTIALPLAARAGKYENMQLLLELGCPTDIPFISGEENDTGIRLIHALASGITPYAFQCIKLLLTFGAKSLTYDNCGRTPLHIASFHRQLDIANILIGFCPTVEDKVTLVNAVDNNGATALDLVKSRLFNNLISLDFEDIFRLNLDMMRCCKMVSLLCLWGAEKDHFLEFVTDQSYDLFQLRALVHQPSAIEEGDIEEIAEQLRDELCEKGIVMDIEEAVRQGIAKYNEMTASDRIQLYSDRRDQLLVRECGSCHRLFLTQCIGAIINNNNPRI